MKLELGCGALAQLDSPSVQSHSLTWLYGVVKPLYVRRSVLLDHHRAQMEKGQHSVGAPNTVNACNVLELQPARGSHTQAKRDITLYNSGAQTAALMLHASHIDLIMLATIATEARNEFGNEASF
eukprot:1145480-Pelagomonas_calceolata.AAC.3